VFINILGEGGWLWEGGLWGEGVVYLVVGGKDFYKISVEKSC